MRRRVLEAVDELARPGGGSSVVPPRRLRARVGAPGAREFAEGGRATARRLADALADCGLVGIERPRALLDFGCGCARVLAPLAERVAGARCVGVDVDAEAVAWARARFQRLELAVIGFEPPLPFEPGEFDLVYSISVLSHLDEREQDGWLAELARVLAPGGVALISVHGPSAFEAFRVGETRTAWCPPEAFAREALAEEELAFVPYERSRWNRGELPGVAAAYGLTFHGHGYVRARWPAWLEVLDVRERAISGWQDLVVCRRADGAHG
jgi:SAM-dependent methyltransferase